MTIYDRHQGYFQYEILKKFLLILPLIIILTLVISKISLKANYIVLIGGGGLITFFVFNYKLVFTIYVFSLYAGISVYFISIAEVLTLFLFTSFVLTFRIKFIELKNPLVFPFIIFLCTVIPSYFKSGALIASIILSYHLFAFVILFAFTNLFFSDYTKIKYFVQIYVLGALVNALYIIFFAIIEGKRFFGFSGIMYVDLVSVAIILCLIGFIYDKGKRIFYGVPLIVLFVALIFTQTRSIWIVCGLTMFGILIQAYINLDRFSLNKSKFIISAISIFILLLALILILPELNPSTFERVALQSRNDDPADLSKLNSIATRYFIWDTAWNAFILNPIFGIGFYSFPFTSVQYARIDPRLYELVVKGLTAHTTILSLLAEVGLLGFAGFIFFLYKTIQLAKKNLILSRSNTQWYYSSMIFWINIYIMFSMIVTDAWLWGTLLMLWGIIHSMSVANYRLLLQNK